VYLFLAGSAFIRLILPQKSTMKYTIEVKVMPLKELLDPQGKAVVNGLGNLGLSSIEDVRIGKNIRLQINASSADEARQLADEASKKLLANAVMEYYELEIVEEDM
jgi:phosphoribosylformylglycinamidine synthase PurS subunit